MDKPRAAQTTIKEVDEYMTPIEICAPEVRSFEAFKHLHVGMISQSSGKTLPEISLIRRIGK